MILFYKGPGHPYLGIDLVNTAPGAPNPIAALDNDLQVLKLPNSGIADRLSTLSEFSLRFLALFFGNHKLDNLPPMGKRRGRVLWVSDYMLGRDPGELLDRIIEALEDTAQVVGEYDTPVNGQTLRGSFHSGIAIEYDVEDGAGNSFTIVPGPSDHVLKTELQHTRRFIVLLLGDHKRSDLGRWIHTNLEYSFQIGKDASVPPQLGASRVKVMYENDRGLKLATEFTDPSEYEPHIAATVLVGAEAAAGNSQGVNKDAT